ncbi:50S ribosomal protein L19 [Candidatus Chromulinivorax destructor]|uniref:50S ribosomal protein L19 n=1 Tax=Candidatus Chromulinivorax destructor TaxID=2066483 RepID=A0A345ZD22_9BACT|nr:50S ribosomal protein L19 [Candidatus Chromulinivorax destructor]
MYERNFPQLCIGDILAVSQWVEEGNKRRIQIFEGNLIAQHKKGASSTFTVRKIGANGIAVERIFPFYAPMIESIKVVTKAQVRRAKLYYLRDRVGRAARVKEKIQRKIRPVKDLRSRASQEISEVK